MDIMQSIIFIIIAVGLVYYFLVATSIKKQRTRVIDLLVAGLLLFVSSYLEGWLPKQLTLNSTQIAGFLIFAYGWIIVIREKFREGLGDQ
ncbi:MAG: hypothetical protein ACOX2E_02675 [Syntrophaceticus sp.]